MKPQSVKKIGHNTDFGHYDAEEERSHFDPVQECQCVKDSLFEMKMP